MRPRTPRAPARWVFATAAALAACLPGADSDGPGDRTDRAEVQAVVGEYAAAVNRADAVALAALYAPDAYLLPPGHGPVEGREAIEAFWRERLEPGFDLEALRIEIGGRSATVVARYLFAATDTESADSGKYVLTLRKERTGRWLLTADIWNSSGPTDDDPHAPGGDGHRRDPALVS